MTDLLNRERVAILLKNAAPYCVSHGGNARTKYLGGALLYYSFAFMYRAKLAVCVGSGTGLVPRMMWQGQVDAGVENPETILIDADDPEVGWLQPDKDRLSWTLENFGVTFWRMLSSDGAKRLNREYVAGRGLRPDYIHIDADHTAEGALRDWEDYSPLLSERGVITLHDTDLHNRKRHKYCKHSGVDKLVEQIRNTPGWDICDLYDIGDGCAIAKRTRADQ